MDKERIVWTLGAVVAFLLPLGVYCLYVASINRRSRPLLVGGMWDAAGLLFALSGFLLVTGPMLLADFYRHVVDAGDGDVEGTWLRLILTVIYYLLVICGGGLLMLSRANKTMIYNVDLERLPKALERAFALVGREVERRDNRLVAMPMKMAVGDGSTAFMEATPKPPSAPDDSRRAELTVDAFAMMCHATLHWTRCTPALREEIEIALQKSLDEAAPVDNPAAGWFMSASGMILGVVTAIAVAWMFVAILTRR